MNEKRKPIKAFSFMPGWKQSRRCDGEQLKSDLMKVLGITSREAWMQRRRGEVEPSAGQKMAIERVFAKYKIKSNIWGYETDEYKSDTTGV